MAKRRQAGTGHPWLGGRKRAVRRAWEAEQGREAQKSVSARLGDQGPAVVESGWDV